MRLIISLRGELVTYSWHATKITQHQLQEPGHSKYKAVIKRRYEAKVIAYLKWSFLVIKQNGIKHNSQKFTCKPISILCKIIRVCDVTYVGTQFHHSKLCNFMSIWETVKTTIRLCKKFFVHKINKNMQRKPWMKCFVHSWVQRHSSQIQNFVTS